MIPPPITDAQLAELVQSMPVSPRLLAELAPRLQKVEVALSDVTELLRRDPALTARLIAMANSATYARAEPATSLEEAVACIGFREVYRLIGAVAASQLGDEPLRIYAIEPQRFRENALFVALLMEEFATAAEGDPRAAYTMGLLRSIGKVALDRHARKIGSEVAPIPDDGTPLLEWERATWGCTSADLGARILAAWRFPAETIEAVRHHYEPSSEDTAMSHLLNISAGAADLRGYGYRGEESYWQFSAENFARTQVDEGKLVWAGERAFQTLKRISSAMV